MTKYELSPEEYKALMKKLDSESNSGTHYADLGDGVARHGMVTNEDGKPVATAGYSQSYIARGKSEQEAVDAANTALRTKGQQGNPVADVKECYNEFGVLTKVIISTEDEDLAHKIDGVRTQPKEETKTDVEGFVGDMKDLVRQIETHPELAKMFLESPGAATMETAMEDLRAIFTSHDQDESKKQRG